MNVAVVGGGVMGLNVAAACLQRGWNVTVYDQGAIPNPVGSGYDRHRLIRFPYGEMTGYSRLVHQAYSAWSDLFAQFPSDKSYYEETGTLSIGKAGSVWIQGSSRALNEIGVSFELLDQTELNRRYPHFHTEPDEAGLYTNTGGVLLADVIMEAVTRLISRQGATFVSHSAVQSVKSPSKSETVVFTSSSRSSFDFVFVTTGAWYRPGDHQDAAVIPRVTPSRQILAYLASPPEWMPEGNGPILLDLDRNGEMYIVPGVKGTPVKMGLHNFSLQGHPDDPRTAQPEECLRHFDHWTARFPGDNSLSGAEFRACYYAVTEDGRLFLHQAGNVIHIGGGNGHAFKFAPVIGTTAVSVAAGEMDATSGNRLLRGES